MPAIVSASDTLRDLGGGPPGKGESSELSGFKAPGEVASAGDCGRATGNAGLRAVATMGAAKRPEGESGKRVTLKPL